MGRGGGVGYARRPAQAEVAFTAPGTDGSGEGEWGVLLLGRAWRRRAIARVCIEGMLRWYRMCVVGGHHCALRVGA